MTVHALPWRPSGLRRAGMQTSAERVLASAGELVHFYHAEPELAAQAGVETLALEAKTLLGARDFASIQRLDGIVSVASRRMAGCIESMDRDASGGQEDLIGRLAGIIGVANGALALLSGARLI